LTFLSFRYTSLSKNYRNLHFFSIFFATHANSASLGAPFEHESEVVGTGGIDGVLRQRALSPGVDTPYSVDFEVDIQIDKTASLDISGMTGLGVKIFLTIVPGSDAEGLEACDAERGSCC
jgi:hypothetical protein